MVVVVVVLVVVVVAVIAAAVAVVVKNTTLLCIYFSIYAVYEYMMILLHYFDVIFVCPFTYSVNW